MSSRRSGAKKRSAKRAALLKVAEREPKQRKEIFCVALHDESTADSEVVEIKGFGEMKKIAVASAQNVEDLEVVVQDLCSGDIYHMECDFMKTWNYVYATPGSLKAYSRAFSEVSQKAE